MIDLDGCGGYPNCYASLQTGLNEAGPTNIVEIEDGRTTTPVIFDRPGTRIEIEAGYNSSGSQRPNPALVVGSNPGSDYTSMPALAVTGGTLVLR